MCGQASLPSHVYVGNLKVPYMTEFNAKLSWLRLFTKYWRILVGTVAVGLVGGGTVMLSAQPLPPATTDPAVIAAALKSCDAGNYQDCYIYGRAMSAKSNGPEVLIPAFERIEKACNGGVVNACYGAGRRHAVGLGVKIDLKKARDYEQRGCKGGDDRACAVLKRLGAPPPSAAGLTGLSATAQGNVNSALYFEHNGADILARYADDLNFEKDPKTKWNMKATACEMGNAGACVAAALAFTEVGGFNGDGKKDLPRAIQMAKIGCDGNDSMSCHLLGTLLSVANKGYASSASQAAYQKAYPNFVKQCEAGNGFYCDAVASYFEGIAFPFDGPKVEYYYSKGCGVGYQRACDGYAKAQDKKRQLAAQDAQRQQQKAREDRYMLYMWGPAPKDLATLSQCTVLKNEYSTEIDRYNRSGETLVQGANALNINSKRSAIIAASERSCVALLDIAERAGNAGCYGEMYRGMMKQIPMFEGVSTSGACYHRSIEMGANWNFIR